jgi:hypothetical protein
MSDKCTKCGSRVKPLAVLGDELWCIRCYNIKDVSAEFVKVRKDNVNLRLKLSETEYMLANLRRSLGLTEEELHAHLRGQISEQDVQGSRSQDIE